MPERSSSFWALESIGMKVTDLYGTDDEAKKTKQHNTRASHKAKSNVTIKEVASIISMKAHTAIHRGPSQYKIWDRGKQQMRTVHYPYHEPSNPKALATKSTLPAGMAPSMELIKAMDACDVEHILPRHWHQSKGLVYRTRFPLYYQVFTDASHACCGDTRQSIVSIVVNLGGNAVYWKNSYTKGTISIACNPIQRRNLHVHARYSYVDDQYDIVHLPTESQVADVGCTFKGSSSFLLLKKLPRAVRSRGAQR
jgi:hypothetical protein